MADSTPVTRLGSTERRVDEAAGRALRWQPEWSCPKGFRTEIQTSSAFHDEVPRRYGVGDVQFYFHLIGPDGAMTWNLGTGWYLPSAVLEMPARAEVIRDYGYGPTVQVPDGHAVSWHKWARRGLKCDLSPSGFCKGDQGFILGEQGVPVLLVNGLNGVWKWLLDFYEETNWSERGRWS